MGNKDQKRQKENPQEKTENKNKSFKDFKQNSPKPFQQFSNPNKSGGGPPKSFNAFHRRLGK